MPFGKGSFAFLAIALLVTAALLLACGGKQSTSGATVNVSLSDPPTCSSPVSASTSYSHVFVTIADVQISTNPNAGDNDSSWVDLTPSLKSAPKQVDLLSPPASGCFLATLGAAGIPAGKYQQIRLMLTDTPVSGNQCGGTANCVMLASAPTTPIALNLSSQDKTGIKIPSGQIAGGAFTVANGDTKDLNIDFDGCASVVMQGSGQYRLKPVLHAGEVSAVSSITGQLVDQNGSPITNASNAIIALEQKDSNNIDRVVAQVAPDSSGNFSLCPLTAGTTYDVVAVAIISGPAAYGPTVVASVPVGTSLGKVTVNVTPGASTQPAKLQGQVTNNSGVGVDYTLSALEQISNSPVWITVPMAAQQVTTLNLTSATGADCPPNTFCADFQDVEVPAATITVGTLGSNGISYATGAGSPSYKVEASAFQTTTHVADCTVPVQSSAAINVTAGTPSTASIPPFAGCQ